MDYIFYCSRFLAIAYDYLDTHDTPVHIAKSLATHSQPLAFN